MYILIEILLGIYTFLSNLYVLRCYLFDVYLIKGYLFYLYFFKGYLGLINHFYGQLKSTNFSCVFSLRNYILQTNKFVTLQAYVKFICRYNTCLFFQDIIFCFNYLPSLRRVSIVVLFNCPIRR